LTPILTPVSPILRPIVSNPSLITEISFNTGAIKNTLLTPIVDPIIKPIKSPITGIFVPTTNGVSIADPCNNLCGNGIVDSPVEQCDDGNQIDNDACTNQCLLPFTAQQLSQANSCARVRYNSTDIENRIEQSSQQLSTLLRGSVSSNDPSVVNLQEQITALLKIQQDMLSGGGNGFVNGYDSQGFYCAGSCSNGVCAPTWTNNGATLLGCSCPGSTASSCQVSLNPLQTVGFGAVTGFDAVGRYCSGPCNSETSNGCQAIWDDGYTTIASCTCPATKATACTINTLDNVCEGACSVPNADGSTSIMPCMPVTVNGVVTACGCGVTETTCAVTHDADGMPTCTGTCSATGAACTGSMFFGQLRCTCAAQPPVGGCVADFANNVCQGSCPYALQGINLQGLSSSMACVPVYASGVLQSCSCGSVSNGCAITVQNITFDIGGQTDDGDVGENLVMTQIKQCVGTSGSACSASTVNGEISQCLAGFRPHSISSDGSRRSRRSRAREQLLSQPPLSLFSMLGNGLLFEEERTPPEERQGRQRTGCQVDFVNNRCSGGCGERTDGSECAAVFRAGKIRTCQCPAAIPTSGCQSIANTCFGVCAETGVACGSTYVQGILQTCGCPASHITHPNPSTPSEPVLCDQAHPCYVNISASASLTASVTMPTDADYSVEVAKIITLTTAGRSASNLKKGVHTAPQIVEIIQAPMPSCEATNNAEGECVKEHGGALVASDNEAPLGLLPVTSCVTLTPLTPASPFSGTLEFAMPAVYQQDAKEFQLMAFDDLLFRATRSASTSWIDVAQQCRLPASARVEGETLTIRFAFCDDILNDHTQFCLFAPSLKH